MAIFLRAYAIVGVEIPDLRRAWMPFPWAHLYEHPECIASVLVEREIDGEHMVLGAKVRRPEQQSLSAIDAHLRRYQETPAEKITAFRQLLHWPGCPGP